MESGDGMHRMIRENWLTLLFLGLLVLGYVLLRTSGDEMASTTEFEAQISQGTPTLVEFYSNR